MKRNNSLFYINKNGKAHLSVVICDAPQGSKTVTIGDNYNLRSGTVIYKDIEIGEGFQTGHNAVIREKNIIGRNVTVGVNSYLGPGNIIGNNVKIHTNCFIESCEIGDDVIIAPGVVFTNDPYPPCNKCVKKVGGAKVGENTVIGANCTILPGVRIGKNCLIGAGSVVTKDVPDGVVAVGNPAKIIKKTKELKHLHR